MPLNDPDLVHPKVRFLSIHPQSLFAFCQSVSGRSFAKRKLLIQAVNVALIDEEVILSVFISLRKRPLRCG